ncbi:MAG: hypothetical protein ABI895_11505 [Deltaproteobacteria bacterium]
MNAPPQESFEARATRLSCATFQFQRTADVLVLQVRQAMGVPDQAEPEVEQEFRALRATLDDFYPEFTRTFSGLLTRCLGQSSRVVLSSLECEPVQAYLRVADAIDLELAAALGSLAAKIEAALSSSKEA